MHKIHNIRLPVSTSHVIFKVPWFITALRIPRWALLTLPVTQPVSSHSGKPRQINGIAWGGFFLIELFWWAGGCFNEARSCFHPDLWGSAPQVSILWLKRNIWACRAAPEVPDLTRPLCRAWHFPLNLFRPVDFFFFRHRVTQGSVSLLPVLSSSKVNRMFLGSMYKLWHCSTSSTQGTFSPQGLPSVSEVLSAQQLDHSDQPRNLTHPSCQPPTKKLFFFLFNQVKSNELYLYNTKT